MLEKITIPLMPVLIKDLGMLYPTETSVKKYRYGIYKCSCGSEFKTQTRGVKNGNVKACGCYQLASAQIRKTKHGMKSHRLYDTWVSIMSRTSNPKNKHYKDYGGRGIDICDRWKDVKNFIEDVFPSFKEGLSIDRINNDVGYKPDNFRWVTQTIQGRNTRIIMSTNKSGYRGVSWHKSNNNWRACITVNGKSKHIGNFNTTIEAAMAYNNYVTANNLEHTINVLL